MRHGDATGEGSQRKSGLLITLIVYALPLHEQSSPGSARPLFFHAYTLWAFAAVLMTYFGVNYLLGGMPQLRRRIQAGIRRRDCLRRRNGLRAADGRGPDPATPHGHIGRGASPAQRQRGGFTTAVAATPRYEGIRKHAAIPRDSPKSIVKRKRKRTGPANFTYLYENIFRTNRFPS